MSGAATIELIAHLEEELDAAPQPPVRRRRCAILSRMRFDEFYAERTRVVGEADDVQAFKAGVERLRHLAATVDDDPDKAQRYLEATERMLLEVTAPHSETVDRAFEAMLLARRLPPGTAAEQRAHVEAGIAEVARIAAAAPTDGERDAALEMNAALLRVLERIEPR